MKLKIVTACCVGIVFLAGYEYATAQVFSVREFVIDTLGKPVGLIENKKGTFDLGHSEGKVVQEWTNTKGVMKDSVSGATWSIEYEKKGASRQGCNPPVLNITMKDAKGKTKPLFFGTSTYQNNTALKYAKIRMVPDCELWGFNINVLLREYFVYSMLRKFGLPIVDVVGFANVTFKSSDVAESETYRYMLMQRDNESKDDIAFTTQFNFLPDLIEASDSEKGLIGGIEYPEGGMTVTYQSSGKRGGEFEVDNLIRVALFTGLFNMNDRSPLHNEDYGIDVATGKVKKIPFDFDMSIGSQCSASNLTSFAPNDVVREIMAQAPQDKKQLYTQTLVKISKEIFDTQQTLSSMLAVVDRYPLSDDKNKLKEYLKKNFGIYATYFGSKRFTDDMAIVYTPFSNPVSVSTAKKSIVVRSPSDGETVNDQYRGEYTATGVSFFKVEIIDDKGNASPIRQWNRRGVCDGVYDFESWYVEGPIDPNAYFTIRLSDVEDPAVYGESGKFKIKSTREFVGPTPIRAIPVGPASINVLSPVTDEVLEKGKSYVIRYKASNIFEMNVDLMDIKGNKLIRKIETIRPNAFGDFYWNVPKDLDLERDDYFTIQMSDAQDPKVKSKSGKFRIAESHEPSMEIISSTFGLEYDNNRKESGLTSKISVSITAHKSADLIIDKEGMFLVGALSKEVNGMYNETKYTTRTPVGQVGTSYKIPAGTNVIFDLTTRFNPKAMFAGSYQATLWGFGYGEREREIAAKYAPENYSNAVVIVGETSPYIINLFSSSQPPPIDQSVTIVGERFGVGMIDVAINGKKISLLAKKFGAKGLDQIEFIPKDVGIEAGWIQIQIMNSVEGNSNMYNIEFLPAKAALGTWKDQFANILQAIEGIFSTKNVKQ